MAAHAAAGCSRFGRAATTTASTSCAPHSSADARVLVLTLAGQGIGRRVSRASKHCFRARAACSGRSRICTDCAPTAPIRGRWLRHAAWPEDFHPLIDAAAPASAAAPAHRRLRIRRGGGRRRARNSRWARCMRGSSNPDISAFPWSARRCSARGAPRLCSQRHRTALHRDGAARGPPSGGARLGRFGRGVLLGLLPGARRHGGCAGTGARGVAAGARPGTRAPRQSPGRSRRARQRRRLRLRTRAILPAQGAAAARHRTSPRDSAISWTSSCRAARVSICTRNQRPRWRECVGCHPARDRRAADDLRRTRRIARPVRGRRRGRRRRWPRNWA